MSHNSDGGDEISPFDQDEFQLPGDANGQLALPLRLLTGSQRKTAFALRHNCETMITGNGARRLKDFRWVDKEGKERTARHWVAEDEAGNSTAENLNCTGFLTLTVGDYVCGFHGTQLPAKDDRERWTDKCPHCNMPMKFVGVRSAKEANRRFNNLNRHIFGLVFEKAVVVSERHESRNIHFHALGIVAGRPDIRTGFNHEAVKRRNYSSASDALRVLWALLREKLPEYGFGRAELTPVKSVGEAVACYVSKYIEKNICNRTADDHRKRLVRYIGWKKTQLKPNEFSWASARACAWRGKARDAASLLLISEREECVLAFGPRWALHLTEAWQGRTPDDTSPFLVADWMTRRLLANDLAQLSRKKSPGWLKLRETPWVQSRHVQFVRDGVSVPVESPEDDIFAAETVTWSQPKEVEILPPDDAWDAEFVRLWKLFKESEKAKRDALANVEQN